MNCHATRFCLKTPSSARERGSIYLFVLASSLIITVIGMGSLFAVRVQSRSALTAEAATDVRLCAQSALELGLLKVGQDPNWRTTQSNGTWISNMSLGAATLSLEGIDPLDGDLTDNEYEPLVLNSTGQKGLARYKTQVTLVPNVKALEALNTCVHASGKMDIHNGEAITASGAPISTNGEFKNEGTVTGDVHADTVSKAGTVTGDLTAPADQKALPDPAVITDYLSKATTVAFTGDIDKRLLTPADNPWGTENADGVYFIDTGDQDLTIKDSRIHGTLIVDVGGKTLFLKDSLLLHAYRLDYPVLIVIGKLNIELKSGEILLSETDLGTNFNPPGVPYLGQMDDDTDDDYPNEIQGLIHATKDIKFKETAHVVGAIISEHKVHFEGSGIVITHDPSLYASPPEGYTYVDGMKVSPGSYQRVVD